VYCTAPCLPVNASSPSCASTILPLTDFKFTVVECDLKHTAQHIHENCDSSEYETTANCIDLRFIPDGTVFDDYKPHDECTQDPTDYVPTDFTTDVSQIPTILR
jgi:hypothetical protein